MAGSLFEKSENKHTRSSKCQFYARRAFQILLHIIYYLFYGRCVKLMTYYDTLILHNYDILYPTLTIFIRKQLAGFLRAEKQWRL